MLLDDPFFVERKGVIDPKELKIFQDMFGRHRISTLVRIFPSSSICHVVDAAQTVLSSS